MVVEKYLDKHRKLFCAFVDLEKAYDRVNCEKLWNVLSMYGLSSQLIRAIGSLYTNSSACVRVNTELSQWFALTKGVKQGCVMSPWLFNLYIDHCIRPLKDLNVGVNLDGVKVNVLMFADDLVLMAENERDLQKIVSCVYESCARNDLNMNVKKTKVMIFERESVRTECVIQVQNEELEQVNEYVYLGSMFTRDGRCESDIERRKTAGTKVNGALRPIMKSRNVSIPAKKLLHQAILLPTLMYGSESWTWLKKDESGINAVEMRSLRRMCGRTLRDRVRNADIREMCDSKKGVITSMKVNKLRWFGHIERMSDERLTKRIYGASKSGARRRGRPRLTWIKHIEQILKDGHVLSTRNRRRCMRTCMSVEEAREVCKDRNAWRSVLSAYPGRDTA